MRRRLGKSWLFPAFFFDYCFFIGALVFGAACLPGRPSHFPAANRSLIFTGRARMVKNFEFGCTEFSFQRGRMK
jgi:hypothetical protein